ncbi:unnamed protein product [Protopolystoma xenopodis]|uniref:Uncharacterized protein n=1 Tax=Protopolystoma xenopodis TaxID=117903 RepID=A0A448XF84_9PLAT|nr:unnamed protein product [Protopolystoma xenopodis]
MPRELEKQRLNCIMAYGKDLPEHYKDDFGSATSRISRIGLSRSRALKAGRLPFLTADLTDDDMAFSPKERFTECECPSTFHHNY